MGFLTFVAYAATIFGTMTTTSGLWNMDMVHGGGGGRRRRGMVFVALEVGHDVSILVH